MKRPLKNPIPIYFMCAIALLLCQQSASGQVRAAFSANSTEGCAPLVVQFIDESTGNPDYWQWDLGNGTISLFQNPSTAYFLPGTYPVKLVVRNAAGADSVVKLHYITVYGNPLANFTATDSVGCFPLKVQFTDKSNGNGRTIAHWHWDFGDGHTSTLQNPVHTYLNAGNHTVTLKITTDKGCTNTFSKEQFIRISSGVNAQFSDSAGKNCQAPLTMYFTNASSGPGTLSYSWDFGDGSRSAQLNPVHTYTSNGTYTVSLVTISDAGCRDTLRRTGWVKLGTSVTQFNAPDSICAGQAISITNTSSPVPLSAQWNFGDGSSSTALHPDKNYSNAGTYFIKLVNTYAKCVDSITEPIKVFSKPTATFTADRTSFCGVPASVQFTGSTNGMAYRWDFGDGTTGNTRDPLHTYTAYGTFTVKYYVTGAGGCTDSIIKNDFITIERPKIQVNGLPTGGCLPFTVPFSATVVVQDNIAGWYWDFGDGTTSSLAAPVKTYTVEGVYTVKLVVTTASGCKDSVKLQNAVRANKKPEMAFSAVPTDVCAAGVVQFTNESTPAGTRWRWHFGDGGTGTSQHPAYKYNDTGYFNVTLITWNNECSDTLVKNKYVYIRPPIARFLPSMTCTDKYSRTFNNTSLGAKTWEWDFGDGTTGTDWNASHRYTVKGIYRVKLTVTNGTCIDSTIRNVTIADEHPDFAISNTEACKGNAVTFTMSQFDATYMSVIAWNFGDGTTSNAQGTVNHSYKNPGTYKVVLYFTDVNGCSDSVVKTELVHVYGPSARFMAEQPTVCAGSTAVFSDQSVTDGTHPITEWNWYYGDGNFEKLTTPPFIHTYAATGKYTVALVVRDSRGCMDSLSKPTAITISKPVAAFASVDTNTCPGKPVSFINTSVGSNLKYRWDFGDGNISTAASPVNTYAAAGMYTVRLYITDAYGCMDSVIKEDYVRITIPVAVFTASDSMSSCPPLQVQFTSQAQNYTTLKWDFGDGSTSSLENPEHFYNMPGTYYVKQIIRGPGGCTDTAVKKMVVKGPQGAFTYAPLTGCKPLTVTMKATSPDKVSFVWDFNDGTVMPGSDLEVKHTYVTAGSFIPKLILIDSTGCRVPLTGKDTLKVIGVTARAEMDGYRVCDSGFIQFTDRSVANDFITGHYWNFGDGTTSTLSNPRHYYKAEGIYTIKHAAISAQGCTDTLLLSDTIKVWRKPDITIEGDHSACEPASLSFRPGVLAGDSSRFTWQWNFGNGKTDLRPNPDSQPYPAAGNYTVQLQVAFMGYCRDTAYRPVTIWPLPATFAGNDTFVCRDNPVRLQATGADRYAWTTAPGISCTDCASPLINPVDNTSYVVTGYTGYGCSRSDTIHVRVRQQFDMKVQAGDTLCEGQALQLAASGAELYQWLPVDGLNDPYAANPRASPSKSTMYTVVGRDSDGCFADTAQVPVIVYPVPRVFAGNDTTVITGSNLKLQTVNSPDITQWKWSPATGLSCIDCAAPVAAIKNSATYRVDVANAGGCRSWDDITVHSVCNTGNWFLPNTFSPNGDGANDVFYVRGKGLNRIHSLKIFNRWGQLVFEKRDITPNDPSAGWDGMFNGKKADMDTYVYIAEVICDNSAIVPFKGDVTLIR